MVLTEKRKNTLISNGVNSVKYLLGGLTLFLIALPAKAVCPVCTVAVVAGVGLSRYLGIDDTIAGVWVGAVTVVMVLWTIVWLNKKNYRWPLRDLLMWVLWYAVVVLPLVWTDVVGHPLNQLWGVDKLLFGIIFGSIIFYFADASTDWLKQKNNGKVFFPLQRVVVPVVSLLIFSGVFYYLTR